MCPTQKERNTQCALNKQDYDVKTEIKQITIQRNMKGVKES